MTAGVPTPSTHGAAMSRRSVMRLLVQPAMVYVIAGARPARADRLTLTPSQERLAALGARLEAADRATADRLFAYARGACGSHTGRPVRSDDACAALLEETRVRREFRAGETQPVDGWILARSEAAACVFLHRLRSASHLA